MVPLHYGQYGSSCSVMSVQWDGFSRNLLITPYTLNSCFIWANLTEKLRWRKSLSVVKGERKKQREKKGKKKRVGNGQLWLIPSGMFSSFPSKGFFIRFYSSAFVSVFGSVFFRSFSFSYGPRSFFRFGLCLSRRVAHSSFNLSHLSRHSLGL